MQETKTIQIKNGKFKIGDRIAVYGFDPNDAATVHYRIIEEFSGTLIITDAGEYVHPKQCRKLTQKTRRRVWISLKDLDEGWGRVLADRNKDSFGDGIEFVEIRKKK